MERIEDKIIKDKINSLDTLPEGYAPSLHSKWELLEAGLQEKKPRKKRIFYLSIAACLFLLCGFGWLLLNEFSKAEKPNQLSEMKAVNPMELSTNKAEITAHDNNAENKIRVSENAQAEVTAHPGANISPTVFRRGRGGNITAPEQGIAGQVRNDEKGTVPQLLTSVNILNDSLEINSLNTISAAKSSQKKRKARFVEIDFEDGPRTNTLPDIDNYAENTFKFRFGVSANNNNNYNSDYGHTSFLKINKSFPVKDN